MIDTVKIGAWELPRIGFGTLYLTEQRGFGPVRPTSIALLKEAADLGVRFFDTADSYGNGAAEEAVRDALHPYDNLLITSKGGFRHERLGAWMSDAGPDRLRDCLEGSLRRLKVDCIDLYQLHCPDSRVPYADSVGAMAEFQRQGKIRHIGISNVSVAQIETARREAEIVSVQNAFNIRHGRSSDVLAYCEKHGLVFIPWMPLGDGGIPWDDPTLVALSTKYNVLPAQIALAALRQRSASILPIPGTSNIDHLRENVAAANLALDADDLTQIWGH